MRRSPSMPALFVGVITPTGIPRNPKLLESLRDLGRKPTVSGISFSDIQGVNSTKLSMPEIACKMSHSMMYEKAVNDYEWALIVEDDVEVNIERLIQIWNILEGTSYSAPQIVSCYLGKWGVLKKSKSIPGALTCLYPPDGALCYFINKGAMEIALKEFDHIRPADWPLWSSDVDFQVFPFAASEMRGLISLIDPLEERIRKNRNLVVMLKELLGFHYFREIGINLKAIHAISYWVYRQRIIWYLPQLFKAKRSSEFL